MEQTPSRLVHQQQGAAPPPLKPFCPPIVIVSTRRRRPSYSHSTCLCDARDARSHSPAGAPTTSDAQETNYDSVGMRDP